MDCCASLGITHRDVNVKLLRNLNKFAIEEAMSDISSEMIYNIIQKAFPAEFHPLLGRPTLVKKQITIDGPREYVGREIIIATNLVAVAKTLKKFATKINHEFSISYSIKDRVSVLDFEPHEEWTLSFERYEPTKITKKGFDDDEVAADEHAKKFNHEALSNARKRSMELWRYAGKCLKNNVEVDKTTMAAILHNYEEPNNV